MNIFSFTAHFDSEETYRLHFKSERDKIGIKCHRCGDDKHYWIKNRWSCCIQCINATIVANFNLSLSYHF